MASISTLVDRVKIFVNSSGTGPFVLGAAVPAFRGAEALADGFTYSYAVENGSNYEAGTGEYVAGTGQILRTPTISSQGGAPVAFPAGVQIAFTALAQDLIATGGDLALRGQLAAVGGAEMVGSDDGASGAMWTTLVGFISYLRSSVGAAIVGFMQAGVGAIMRSVQAKLRDTVSVKDFGAVGDGVADDTDAIDALEGTGVFPRGEYKITAAVDFGQNFGAIQFANGTPVIYAGGATPGAITLDASANGVNGANAGRLLGTPRVNAAAANYAVEAVCWHRGIADFECTGAAIGGLHVRFGVLTTYKVTVSVNQGAWAGTQPDNGIVIDSWNGAPTTACLFEMPIIEGVSAEGIIVNAGQANNWFMHGTSEGNGGAGVSTSGLRNFYVGMFLEANGGVDFSLGGDAETLFGISAGSAAGSLVEGGRTLIFASFMRKVTINNTAYYSAIRDTGFLTPAEGGGLIDNGVGTRRERLFYEHATGSTLLPDVLPRPKDKIVGAREVTGAAVSGTPAHVHVTIADHGLDWGEVVTFASVGGMTQLNGNSYAVEPMDNNTVRLMNTSGTAYTDGTGFGAYTSGGTATFAAFTNSWTALEAGTRGPVGFSRDPYGRVRFTGAITGGTAASAFTLPVGFRPAVQKNYPAVDLSAGTIGYVTVTAAGLVTPNGTSSYDLNSISFQTA